MRWAFLLLACVATWNTERFQRFAFPDTYYRERITVYEDMISDLRAEIADKRADLDEMKRGDVDDLVVYDTLHSDWVEDIRSAEELIEWYRGQIAASDQALSEFLRQH
ncbi:MAG: hypothetical protein H6948_02315 [Zoogloeaceae bacterium]|nr:hypothetical protein [Zoogloeaceae bacterium]